MEFGYVLRRCPIHDHYIPQFLQVPRSISSTQQTAQRFFFDRECITTCAGASRETRCTYASTNVPVVTERAPVLRHPFVASSPPVPIIMSSTILPQFPAPATSGMHSLPAFSCHYPFSPPLQFPTPLRSTNLTPLTGRSTSLPRAPPMLDSFRPNCVPQQRFTSLFQPSPSRVSIEPPVCVGRANTLSSPSSSSGFTPPAGIEQPVEAHTRPPFSYGALITMAITSSPHEMATLTDIFRYISVSFPYYKHSEKSWKKSIRQCLTSNNCFKKAPFAPSEIKHSRNNYWVIDPLARKNYIKGTDRRTRKRQRQSQKATDDNEFRTEFIPNENTTIVQLVPSVKRETRAVCVLPSCNS